MARLSDPTVEQRSRRIRTHGLDGWRRCGEPRFRLRFHRIHAHVDAPVTRKFDDRESFAFDAGQLACHHGVVRVLAPRANPFHGNPRSRNRHSRSRDHALSRLKSVGVDITEAGAGRKMAARRFNFDRPLADWGVVYDLDPQRGVTVFPQLCLMRLSRSFCCTLPGGCCNFPPDVIAQRHVGIDQRRLSVSELRKGCLQCRMAPRSC